MKCSIIRYNFSVVLQFLHAILLLLQGPNSLGTFKKTLMSKAALTHKFRKLRSPTKCRDCEGIVVFQGVECEEVRSFWNYISPFMLFALSNAFCYSFYRLGSFANVFLINWTTVYFCNFIFHFASKCISNTTSNTF